MAGETKPSQFINLQPDGSVPRKLILYTIIRSPKVGHRLTTSTVSEAPALPQTNAKKKFAIGKREASDDEKRKDLMKKMFATAKDVDEQAEKDKTPIVEDEEKEVADDEWVRTLPSDQ